MGRKSRGYVAREMRTALQVGEHLSPRAQSAALQMAVGPERVQEAMEYLRKEEILKTMTRRIRKLFGDDPVELAQVLLWMRVFMEHDMELPHGHIDIEYFSD